MTIELPKLGPNGAPSTPRDEVIEWFTFPTPVTCEQRTFTKVGLTVLRASAELRASKRAGAGEPMAMAHELVKESIRAFVSAEGDKVIQVSCGDGTTDRVWEYLEPAARTLIISAYQHIHTPAEDATASFLKSRRATV